MKKSIEMRALLVVLVAFLTGCAGMSMEKRPDGTYLGMTTVWHPDRSASEIARFEEDGQNPDGSPRFKEVTKKVVVKRPDGSVAIEEVRDTHLSVGPTVAGQAAVAAVGGVTTAATQGIFGIQIAKETAKACRDGKCGGNGTVIYNNGKAEALSLSESGAKAAVNVSGGGTCTTGSCLAR